MEPGHRSAVGDVPLLKGDVGESMLRPQRYVANDVARSTTLLESLHGDGVERIVFSSTCAVYGTPDRVPVGKDAPIRPESPYGESKAMTERSWPGTTAARACAR